MTKTLATLVLLALSAVAFAFGGVRLPGSPFDLQGPTNIVRTTPPLVLTAKEQAQVTSVEVCVRYRVDQGIMAESLDAEPSLVSGTFTPSDIVLSVDGTVIWNEPITNTVGMFALAPFDGVLDFRGPSGAMFTVAPMMNLMPVVVTDPVLVQKLASGTPVEITLDNHFDTTGPGNYQIVASSMARFTGIIQPMMDVLP